MGSSAVSRKHSLKASATAIGRDGRAVRSAWDFDPKQFPKQTTCTAQKHQINGAISHKLGMKGAVSSEISVVVQARGAG